MYVFVNLQVWIYAIDTVLKTEMNLQDTITEFFALRAFIIWLALWVGKINQILHFDWLPKLAR